VTVKGSVKALVLELESVLESPLGLELMLHNFHDIKSLH
jgi:hypothetical protein